jgi:hypothetical protein
MAAGILPPLSRQAGGRGSPPRPGRLFSSSCAVQNRRKISNFRTRIIMEIYTTSRTAAFPPASFAKAAFLAATALAMGTAIALNPVAAFAQAVDLVVVDVKTVGKGYRASKLIGRDVVNTQKEKIGDINDLIVDKQKVLFAVLEVGGFLGIGGKLVAVDFPSMTLDDPSGKLVLPGATKAELEKLPVYNYEK